MGKQVVARLYGGVAQLGEHLPCKQGVMSSNLTVSIRQKHSYQFLDNSTVKNLHPLGCAFVLSSNFVLT